MRAGAGLDRDDPLGGQHAGRAQEPGVLVGVDVVGDDRRSRSSAPSSRQSSGDQRGLAGADRAADAAAGGLVRGTFRHGTTSWWCGVGLGPAPRSGVHRWPGSSAGSVRCATSSRETGRRRGSAATHPAGGVGRVERQQLEGRRRDGLHVVVRRPRAASVRRGEPGRRARSRRAPPAGAAGRQRPAATVSGQRRRARRSSPRPSVARGVAHRGARRAGGPGVVDRRRAVAPASRWCRATTAVAASVRDDGREPRCDGTPARRRVQAGAARARGPPTGCARPTGSRASARSRASECGHQNIE